jgi:hypothetical protein
MLFPERYYLPIIIVVAIIAFIIFYLLLKKKLNKKILGYAGFAFAFLIYFTLKSIGGKVYLIDEQMNVKRYTAVGSFKVPMKGGATDITCSVPLNRVGIVNQSKKALTIEAIQYSSSNSSLSYQEEQQIQGMAFETVFLNRGHINYFFDDHIPDEISTRGYSSQETKYWLHEL